MAMLYLLSALLSLLLTSHAHFSQLQPRAPRNFTYNRTSFYLDGEPFQIIGGQMDPQRIPAAYWRSRLQYARAMGLNTIFSYVYWNLLEPTPGVWLNDQDSNDIASYFSIAAEEGLNIILRPGPYICGEREWGGFPSWLSTVPGLEVRSNNSLFLAAASNYLSHLADDVSSLVARNGGPILMVQVENEYGSYGADHNYTSLLRNFLEQHFDVLLYTNDGGVNWTLAGGSVPGALAETDGDPRGGFQARDLYITDPSELGPLLDGEYYTLAPDTWGANSSHQTPDNATVAGFVSDMDFVLGGGNSISLYMFHGGTNFGFGNGAILRPDGYSNRVGPYLDVFTTSYDYGAPLDESGRPTPLYDTLRATFSKYVPNGTIPSPPAPVPLMSVPQFTLTPFASLLNYTSPPILSASPVTMESLNQSYGFTLYTHTATTPVNGVLQAGDRSRDRIITYINNTRVGVLDATYADPGTINVELKPGDELQLLVENLGRVDYWSLAADTYNALLQPHKGVVGNVSVGWAVLSGWASYGLPFAMAPSADENSTAPTTAAAGNASVGDLPLLYSGRFWINATNTTNTTTVDATDAKANDTASTMALDTFLTLPNATKGVVWVNGFNLGRYWAIGPQQSLYLPGTIVRVGSWNEVVVLELETDVGGRVGSDGEGSDGGGGEMVAFGAATREWGNRADADR